MGIEEWTELTRKPITIGKCSRGFLIPKEEMTLRSDEEYIVRVIPKRNFYETEDKKD
jgi:hypothetical protein